MSVVFVSSTFRDMHYERDAIRDLVAAKVNDEARKYGQYVSFEDLRWGVDTQKVDKEAEQRKEQKVLDACLDEIDRSDPPMIVILGDRYGWMPGVNDNGERRDPSEWQASLIGDAAARKDLFLEDDLISVTALEVEYGALRGSEQFANTLFYYRTIDGDCDLQTYASEGGIHETQRLMLRRRIEAMREDYESLSGHSVKRYTVRFQDGEPKAEDIRRFADMVVCDVRQRLEAGWKELNELTPLQRTLRLHERFMKQKGQYLFARQAERDSYSARMLSDGSDAHIALKGDPGSGKTTLLASIASAVEERGDNPVLFLSCGYTADSSDAAGVLRLVVEWISSLDEKWAIPGIEKRDVQSLIADLEDLSAKCGEAGVRPALVIDAADRLSADENRDRLVFLPRSAAVNYIVSCTPDFNMGNRTCERLEPISSEGERRAVIESLEKAEARNEMGEEARQYLLSLPASENPLFLSLAMQVLMMLERRDFSRIDQSAGNGISPDEAINAYLRETLEKCPSSLEKMSAKLIMDAIVRTGADKKESMEGAIKYLSISRRGLRREDLERLHAMRYANGQDDHFDDLGFALLRSYFKSCFMQRSDARFDFMHKSIRDGVLAGIPLAERIRLHADILESFQSISADDPVRIDEEAFHAFWARDGQRLIECIARCQKSLRDMGDTYRHSEDAFVSADGENRCKLIERLRWTLACDLRECCESDEERWFPAQLKRLGDFEVASDVIDFVNEQVYPYWVVGSLSVSELRAAKSTLGGVRELAESVRFANDTAESRERLALTCFNLAYVLGILRGSEVKRSLALYRDAYALRKLNRQVNPELYARSTDNLASNLQRAVKEGLDVDLPLLFEDEEEDTDSIGAKVIGFFKEALDVRIELYEKAQARVVDGSFSSDMQKAREDLAWACSNMAAKGIGFEAFKSASAGVGFTQEELYDRALALREDVFRDDSSNPANKEKVAYSQLDLARYLCDEGDFRALEKARILAEGACDLRCEVCDATGSSKSIKDLADARNAFAAVLTKLGEWEFAIDQHVKAIDSSRRAVRLLGTPESKLDLIMHLRDMAITLQQWTEATESDGPVDCNAFGICMLLGESIGWLEGMHLDHPTRQYAELLIDCYNRLISVCESVAPDYVKELEHRKAAIRT